jgi:hypothetical protein
VKSHTVRWRSLKTFTAIGGTFCNCTNTGRKSQVENGATALATLSPCSTRRRALSRSYGVKDPFMAPFAAQLGEIARGAYFSR